MSTARLSMSLYVVKGSKTAPVIVIGLQHLLFRHGMESKSNNGEIRANPMTAESGWLLSSIRA